MSKQLTVSKAIREGLHEEMVRDDKVVVLGEDMAEMGSVFGITQGFLAEFGPLRVMDTPISESGFTGMAVGMAMRGIRPVVEWMYVGDMSRVSLPCMILQPLVENAIVHGLESRVEGGDVEITLWADGTMLMARVRDNGRGFDPEAVRHRAETRVGLKSTRSRLALHYGDSFRFSLQSAPGEGCAITLGVPLALPPEAGENAERA